MPRPRRPKGPTRVSYEVIKPDTIIGQPIYKLLDELIAKHRPELQDAKIALAWCTSWRLDVDGREIIGKCRRTTELDREVTNGAYDFIILLSKRFWDDTRVDPTQRKALLAHEVCHATVKVDARTGDVKVNARRRVEYRTKTHDVEEFSEIIREYGTYKRDLEAFAAALRQATLHEDFTPCETCLDSPGYAPVVEHGVAKVKRCPCWLAWSERRKAAVA